MRWKERAQQLKMDIPAVFLAWKDKETPLIAKAVAGVTVIYALSPIDLIPDFIPLLGYLDDLLLLPALLTLSIKLIPPAVWARCRAKAARLWEDGKPKRWYYAIPVALVWALLLWWVARLIWA